MGILRRNQDDDKRKFQMREKLMSIGDDYWIEDESGNKAFKVDGKAMQMRDTWVLEDANGQEVAKDPREEDVDPRQDQDRAGRRP